MKALPIDTGINFHPNNLASAIGIPSPQVKDADIMLIICDYLKWRGIEKPMYDWTIEAANLLCQGASQDEIQRRVQIGKPTFEAAVSLMRDAATRAGWTVVDLTIGHA